ncbi:hypothetical protein BT63DRAFT_120549 [Microthyrium microscopicum]|uniref:Rhodopsin domain-containing protein n=1 Tax=Microthyrium microscopicum TaxID=703497 RepID=A0A6A6TXC6_9PEZI|nr:hypothetical protein BT63DRAFT_120549 [Microthyrium microscopicum]
MSARVVIAGAVRTYYLSRAERPIADKSWVLFEVWAASIAECNMAIMCACAPSLKSVTGKYFREGFGSKNSSKDSSKDSTVKFGSLGGESSASKPLTQMSYMSHQSKVTAKRVSSIHALMRKFSIRGHRRHDPDDPNEESDTVYLKASGLRMGAYGSTAEGYDDKPLPPIDPSWSPAILSPVSPGRIGFTTSMFDRGPMTPPPIYSETPNKNNHTGSSIIALPILPQVDDTDDDSSVQTPAPESIRLEQNVRITNADHRERRSVTPSVVFIDQNGSEEQVNRVKYHSFVETPVISKEDLLLPQSTSAQGKSQSIKATAESLRQQMREAEAQMNQTLSQRSSHQAPTVPSAVLYPSRPSTAGAVSSQPPPSGFERGSVRDALRHMRSQPLNSDRLTPNFASSRVSSPFSSPIRRVDGHRNSISHISDPSESGGSDDAESNLPQSPSRFENRPSIANYSHATASATNRPKLALITSTFPSSAGRSDSHDTLPSTTYVSGSTSVKQLSNISQDQSSRPMGLQSSGNGSKIDQPNAVAATTAPAVTPVRNGDGAMAIGVAVPCAADYGDALSKFAGDGPGGIGRPKVRRVLSREKWKWHEENS